ncbi:HNH endonuclease, partial [Halobacillus trueperi]
MKNNFVDEKLLLRKRDEVEEFMIKNFSAIASIDSHSEKFNAKDIILPQYEEVYNKADKSVHWANNVAVWSRIRYVSIQEGEGLKLEVKCDFRKWYDENSLRSRKKYTEYLGLHKIFKGKNFKHKLWRGETLVLHILNEELYNLNLNKSYLYNVLKKAYTSYIKSLKQLPTTYKSYSDSQSYEIDDKFKKNRTIPDVSEFLKWKFIEAKFNTSKKIVLEGKEYKSKVDTSFAIENNVLDSETSIIDQQIISEFPEGKKEYITHLVRERDSKVIKLAKQKFKNKYGSLYCEACNFNFKDYYGDLGEDFIEGHHTKYVSKMLEGETTKVEDIAMLCSNCHRM